MEAQLKQAQTDKDAAGTDAQGDMPEDVPADTGPSAGGMILTIQHESEVELTAEAQKNRLARAEAAYGAITEISESAEGSDETVDRRA